MARDYFTSELKKRFSNQNLISRNELFEFYKSFEPDLKEATFSWRIYSLKEKNVLKLVKNGFYTLSAKPQYDPPIDSKLRDIATKISKHFPNARYCVWHTRWLNDWMTHQPGRFSSLVEAEQSATESVFYFLKDENYKNVYLNPDENLLERYVSEHTESIIVKSLVSKAPIRKVKKISIPTSEKILVDLFVERKVFAAFQGSELVNIYNNFYSKYALNITKLLAYAKRRGSEPALLEFITKNTELAELINE